MSVVAAAPARAKSTCRCAACRSGLRPFTLEHFVRWALELELDTGAAWVVEDFFGVFVEDYFAGIPENWLIVPEGNSKTTSLGGFGVYLLEHRPVAAIPWAASSRDQAEIGYRQAEGFIVRDSRLKSFLKCKGGYRRIDNVLTGGRLQVLAADDKTGDGVIPTDAFLDELHRHKDLRLYRTWRGKLEKRGGQMATISTAGEPGGEFETTRERIRQSTPVVERRRGFVHCRSSAIALHEYAVTEGDSVEDMEAVKAANPFSAITVDMLRAKRQSPTMTVEHWRRFVCDIATRTGNAAIQEVEWERAHTDEVIPPGEAIWAGLDVAWKWDTTALVPLWMRDDAFRLFGPATILEPPRDGTSLDPYLVEKALLDTHERNPIHTLVMDTSRAEQLAEWARESLGCAVIDRGQSNAHAVLDYERFMEALRQGWLRHSGDLGLTRHALNAVARILPGGDARFDRPNASRRGGQDSRVIDALIAAAMAHTSASAGADADPWGAGW